MLIQERQLFGFRRWSEDHAPAVGYAVMRAQAPDLAHRPLSEDGRQVRAVAVRLLVARHELRPVPGEYRHEVLARAVLEMQHARPQPGGAGGASRLHDLLEQLGPVGPAGKNRGHADADVDP